MFQLIIKQPINNKFGVCIIKEVLLRGIFSNYDVFSRDETNKVIGYIQSIQKSRFR